MGPNEAYPTVVIGAGLGGLCCAAYLARQGIPVTVIEQHSAPQRDGLRLIPTVEICFFQSSDKYTAVITQEGEFLIRKPVKELDSETFWQIHRGTIVNVRFIDKVSRSLTGRCILKLKGISETLTVSRSYASLFKQM